MRRFISILIVLSVIALATIGALTAPQARFLLPAAAVPTVAAYLPVILNPEQSPTPIGTATPQATLTASPTAPPEDTATPEATLTASPTAPPIGTATPQATPTASPSATPCVTPGAPSLNASRNGSTVSLSWSAVAGAVSYKVYKSSVGSSGPFFLLASPTSTSASDTIARGTTYWYYVSAVNACGVQSSPSNVVSVTRP